MKAMILEEFGGPEILQYMNVPDPLAGPPAPLAGPREIGGEADEQIAPGHVRGKIVLEVSR